ncbi:MAG TPA: DUF3822 family protein [Mariniphaga sp.]|nr:DUF3822 family protein [Mariniphaga sp.]
MTGLIKDPGFDINRTKEYKLSIQVSLNGFSFSVVHEEQKRILALEKVDIKVSSDTFLGRHFEEWINGHEILQKEFKNTVVRYNTESFTFVPSEFNDRDKQQLNGTIALGDQEGKLFVDHYLQNAKGNVVFSVPTVFYDVVEKRFRDIKLKHTLEILDNEVLKLKGIKDYTLSVLFDESSFILILYDNEKPLIISNYNYNYPADVVFYILSALKMMEVNTGDTALIMAGNIAYKGELYTNLKKYFKNSRFLTTGYKYNPELFKEPLYHYPVIF